MHSTPAPRHFRHGFRPDRQGLPRTSTPYAAPTRSVCAALMFPPFFISVFLYLQKPRRPPPHSAAQRYRAAQALLHAGLKVDKRKRRKNSLLTLCRRLRAGRAGHQPQSMSEPTRLKYGASGLSAFLAFSSSINRLASAFLVYSGSFGGYGLLTPQLRRT